MAVETTIDATVPSGTSGDIIFYEDVNANQDGTQVDSNGRAYNNEQTIALEEGSNTYTLGNFTGGTGNEYWFDTDISNTDREAGLSVNSVQINPDVSASLPGTGTLEWTTETEFNNVRDQVGIASDGLGSHPSAGSAFQGYPYGDLRKELILYFPFDDNKSTSTAQNAAHGEPGKLNTVSYVSDALVETRSLSFTSAGSNVSIERYPQAEVEDDVFTASVAFKVDSANVSGDVALFGDKDLSGVNDTAGFVIYLRNNSGTVNVRAAVESSGGTQRTGASSGTNYGDNSWHVATLTKTDDGTFDMYVDGNRVFGMGSLGDITSTNEFRVGIAHNESSNDYRGLIEEVRLYGKAFSQVEAEQLFLIRDSDYQTTSNLPSATPTLRYNFEDTGDTSTATDSQGNSDGTISGATYNTDSVVGENSLEFSGGSDEVDTNTTFNTDADFTWALWYRSDGSNVGKLIENFDSNFIGGSILRQGDGELEFTLQNGGAKALVQNVYPRTIGVWNHAALTWDEDDTVMRAYINGELVGQSTVDPGTTSSPDNLRLGTRFDNNSTLVGQLDDVRVYQSTLTPAQIETIYNFQQPRLPENSTPETGLNGWLPLNESAGDAIDLAAGNDGTVNGPTQGAIGIQGTTAYSFDGTDDSIELVNNYYSLPISVTAWANNNQADGTRRDIINFRDNLRFIIATGVNGANTIDVWDGNWTEVGSYTANEWFHVVATIDSGGLTKIYVDGSLSSVLNLSPTGAAENRNVVGIDPNNNGPWDGRIGEIRTYRRRLRPSEIDLLYRRGNRVIDQATTDPNLAKFQDAFLRFSMDDSDVSSGTLTDTYGDSDGTLFNSPTTGASGVGEGESIDFNGTDQYIDSSFSSTIGPYCTMSVWYNTDVATGTANILDLAADIGNPDDRFLLQHSGTDTIRLLVRDQGANQLDTSFTVDITVGTWIHLAPVWGVDGWELYANGAIVASGSENLTGEFGGIRIGRHVNFDGNYVEGRVDEVRIFDRNLNSHEVWQLYSLGRNQNWVTHNE
jgi:hypothetical protein